MSISQKTAWTQFAIFAALVIGWGTLFLWNGTVFYWQNDTMKMTFYWLNAAAFAALVIMHIVASTIKSQTKVAVDERDKTIFRKALLWATGTSYTVIIAMLVALTATYMNKNSDTISVYFPQLIIFIGGVTLMLTQATAALIMYGRKVNHG